MDSRITTEHDMVVEWDVAIVADDGLVLRADIFRPRKAGSYPTILSYGAYGKGLPFQEGFATNWNRMIEAFPEVAEGTSNKYQNFEVVDPEKWVPDGYVCVRVDSRGAGRSPGHLDPTSPRETKDLYDCIEWTAQQDWSNRKVGLLGISYYASNQWLVASLQPPHLSAICVWEGAADFYRDRVRHGGILTTFRASWFDRQVRRVQHGVGDRGPQNPHTGELVAGPETLTEDQLARNRTVPFPEQLAHPFDDDYYRDRSPNYDKIVVPLLSSGNWGGQGLHPRGNIEGFLAAASEQKWLEMHGNTHFSPFYNDHGLALQKRFFGHFLKSEHTGWGDQPPVELQIRHPGEKFVLRSEQEWPLARTRWTKFYLTPEDRGLTQRPSSGESISYETTGDGVTFLSPPLESPMEITGPAAAKLCVSSDSTDADVFVVLQVFDPEDNEVRFIGSNDPSVPIGLGWLRASHRKLDLERSLPHRPFHTHDEAQPLEPGTPVELDIEIWPTCIVIPAGHRLAVMVRGTDYEHDGPQLPGAAYAMTGVGPFRHNDPTDRPPDIFGGVNTLHFPPGSEPYVLLPVIAEDETDMDVTA